MSTFDYRIIDKNSKILIISDNKKNYREIISNVLSNFDIKTFKKKYIISVNDRPSKLNLNKSEWTVYKFFDNIKKLELDTDNCIIITNLTIKNDRDELKFFINKKNILGIVQSSYPKNIKDHFDYIFIGYQNYDFLKRKIHKNYFGNVPYKEFKRILDRLLESENNFIVIDTKNNKIRKFIATNMSSLHKKSIEI